jgi:hypothetical protein
LEHDSAMIQMEDSMRVFTGFHRRVFFQ